MIADANGNRWLTHPERNGVTPPADFHTVDNYRKHAQEVTGGIKLPAVIYKGQTIPARNL